MRTVWEVRQLKLGSTRRSDSSTRLDCLVGPFAVAQKREKKATRSCIRNDQAKLPRIQCFEHHIDNTELKLTMKSRQD